MVTATIAPVMAPHDAVCNRRSRDVACGAADYGANGAADQGARARSDDAITEPLLRQSRRGAYNAGHNNRSYGDKSFQFSLPFQSIAAQTNRVCRLL